MAGDYGRTTRSPLIEVIEVTRERVQFTLRNADISLANALRRIMIAEVPTLAIELVTVHENTSVLHDEFIAHRLGLLPIDSSRIRDFKYKEECSCADKCRQCTVEFQVDVVCRDEQGSLVTHLDVVPLDPDPRRPVPVPRHEDMPDGNAGIVIAKLRKNQRIKVDVVATKGIGKLHAKWIPAATAVFQYEPDIQINEKSLETVPSTVQQQIAMSCPRQVYSCEGDAFTPHTLAIANRMACIFCDECIVTATEKGYPELITVAQKPDIYRFTVESTGAMPAEQIIEIAFEVLDKKIRDVMNETAKLEGFNQESVNDKISHFGLDSPFTGKREKGGKWDEGFTLDLS